MNRSTFPLLAKLQELHEEGRLDVDSLEQLLMLVEAAIDDCAPPAPAEWLELLEWLEKPAN